MYVLLGMWQFHIIWDPYYLKTYNTATPLSHEVMSVGSQDFKAYAFTKREKIFTKVKGDN